MRAANLLPRRKKAVRLCFCMICDDQKSELEMMQKIISDYAGEHPDLLLADPMLLQPF